MGSGESINMSDCVARRVQEVEAAVSEVVEGFESAYAEVCPAKVHFHDLPTFEVSFKNMTMGVRRISGHKCLFEAFSDDQLRTTGKRGWVSRMIEVPMTNSTTFSTNTRPCLMWSLNTYQ